jgi:hypothetical protein
MLCILYALKCRINSQENIAVFKNGPRGNTPLDIF